MGMHPTLSRRDYGIPALSLLRASIASPTPVPAYYRLAEALRQLIERQVLMPGEQLPPEQKIAELLHVSRPTVRHALQRLERANLIYRERARGTFVRTCSEILASQRSDAVLTHQSSSSAH